MNVVRPGLGWYVNKLNDGELFSFVRYGDGEWDLVLNLGKHMPGRFQRSSDNLEEAMRRTITDKQDYQYAIQSTSYLERLGLLSEAEEWLAEQKVNIEWHSGEVFHKASKHGQLFPLVDALGKQKTVVVGPPWLEELPFIDAHIVIPERNCWQEVDTIEAQVRMHHDAVVSFSAGPAAKIMIHDLHPTMGDHSWLIDFGSLWDVYCGKRSRGYHRGMSDDVIERNLGRR